MPTRWPRRSTRGPPDDPRASGALCSRPPLIRRPRGPRKGRWVPDTRPNPMRVPREPRAMANTTAPTPGVSAAHSSGVMSPVSTSRTTRSPWGSAPLDGALLPSAVPERDLRAAVPEVVGVGQDATRGHDHPGSPAVPPDGHGGRSGPLGHGSGRLLQGCQGIGGGGSVVGGVVGAHVRDLVWVWGGVEWGGAVGGCVGRDGPRGRPGECRALTIQEQVTTSSQVTSLSEVASGWQTRPDGDRPQSRAA